MTGIDTNVIVRLLTGDDPAQAEKARAVFKKSLVFIPETVIFETEWVLRHAYSFTPSAIYHALTKLCGLPNVRLANSQRLLTALQWYAEGVDFADALHLAQSQECSRFVSFDRQFTQKASGKGSCKVQEP
jgi:predicted nucleic-acid-binding protein